MNQVITKRVSYIIMAGLFILSFMAALIPVSRASAATPVGPTKKLIVKYSNVLGANTDTEVQDSTSGYVNQVYKFKHIPFGVYEVDADGEQSLSNNAYVAEYAEERYDNPLADLPIPTIGGNPVDNRFADSGTATVYDGTGYAVAVLDSGVDNTHSLLSGKVVSEACFSTNNVAMGVSSLCPGAVEFASGSGTADDCDAGVYDGCGHGTTVAGAIAMSPFLYDVDTDLTDDLFSGVATGADIVSIQVFSAFDNVGICGVGLGENPCIKSVLTNQLQALDYLVDLDVGKPIVAANMSLGSGNYLDAAECEAGVGSTYYDAYQSIFATLRDGGIATVAANGNEGAVPGNEDKVGSPACVEGAISVGATNILGDTIASYSNNGALTTLLAPGGDAGAADAFMWLPFAGSGTGIVGTTGTSQAAPMVAGAFAVLREKHPDASVQQLVDLLIASGTDVAEGRAGYTVFNKPLIDLGNALSTSTFPVIDTFTGPVGVVNEGSDTILTVGTTDVASCSLDNGIGAVDVSGGTVTVPGFADYELTCVGDFNDEVTALMSPASFNIRPTRPNAGSPLTVSTDSENRTALISWSASTDTDGIDFYEVYLDGDSVDTTEATTFTFTDLGLETEYTADVYAVDTLGARSLVTSVGFVLAAVTTPTAPDTGLPNIFGGLSTQIMYSFGAIVSTGAVLTFSKKYF